MDGPEIPRPDAERREDVAVRAESLYSRGAGSFALNHSALNYVPASTESTAVVASALGPSIDSAHIDFIVDTLIGTVDKPLSSTLDFIRNVGSSVAQLRSVFGRELLRFDTVNPDKKIYGSPMSSFQGNVSPLHINSWINNDLTSVFDSGLPGYHHQYLATEGKDNKKNGCRKKVTLDGNKSVILLPLIIIGSWTGFLFIFGLCLLPLSWLTTACMGGIAGFSFVLALVPLSIAYGIRPREIREFTAESKRIEEVYSSTLRTLTLSIPNSLSSIIDPSNHVRTAGQFLLEKMVIPTIDFLEHFFTSEECQGYVDPRSPTAFSDIEVWKDFLQLIRLFEETYSEPLFVQRLKQKGYSHKRLRAIHFECNAIIANYLFYGPFPTQKFTESIVLAPVGQMPETAGNKMGHIGQYVADLKEFAFLLNDMIKKVADHMAYEPETPETLMYIPALLTRLETCIEKWIWDPARKTIVVKTQFIAAMNNNRGAAMARQRMLNGH